MDQNKFSTTYVPLQPPYQIIKYGEDMGMQIGTLIASSMLEDDPFRIETHSYPVVAYADKNSKKLDKTLYGSRPMEGVVWNRVELRDVLTVCLTGESLTWQEYINFLWADIRFKGFTSSPDFSALHDLRMFGITVAPPSPKDKKEIHLYYKKNEYTEEEVVRSLVNDPLAINIKWYEDPEKMKQLVLIQMLFYKMNIAGEWLTSRELPRFNYKFKSDDKKLAALVESLNSLKDEEWNLVALMDKYYKSLSLEERMKVLDQKINDIDLSGYNGSGSR